MNIADSADLGPGLARFQRQELICRNCGDADSRFVFVPVITDSPSPAASQEPMLGAFELSVAVQNAATVEAEGDAENAAVSEDADETAVMTSARMENAPPRIVASIPEKALADGEPQPEEAATDGLSAEPAHSFAEALQSYLAKWRNTQKGD